MTGFKLHCPPGFVDRAYLVFWLLTLLTELPILDWIWSRSHPFLVVGSVRPDWPGYEPERSRAQGPSVECFGGYSSGGSKRRRRCAIVATTARCFRPRPPGGACPYIQRRQTHLRPVSGSVRQQVTCQLLHDGHARDFRLSNALHSRRMLSSLGDLRSAASMPRSGDCNRRGYERWMAGIRLTLCDRGA